MLDNSQKLIYTMTIDTNAIIENIMKLEVKHKFTTRFFGKYINESSIRLMIVEAIHPFLATLVNEISDFINISFKLTEDNKQLSFEFISFFNHKLDFKTEEERNSWMLKLDNIEKITLENIINDLNSIDLVKGITKITKDYSVFVIDGTVDKLKTKPKTKEEIDKLDDDILIELFGINGPVVKNNLYKNGDVADEK